MRFIMPDFKTPGVYINETSLALPTVKRIETAIPAYIGYTEKGPAEPTRIASLSDYQSTFGVAANELPGFEIDHTGNISIGSATASIPESPVYKMYYMLQLYFANGGGPCYIVSVGAYNSGNPTVSEADLLSGLNMLNNEDEPTLILFPDAQSMPDTNLASYHNLYVQAMVQCAGRGDRFTICDLKPISAGSNPIPDTALAFRTGIGTNNLSYGAAYYPNLRTGLTYKYEEEDISVNHAENANISVLRHSEASINGALDPAEKAEQSLYHARNGQYLLLYLEIKKRIDSVKLTLPPSAAVAGAYVTVDHTRGVWKAPANISLNSVIGPTVAITNSDQEYLNISSSGKSINAIRAFPGIGTMIWGARTLSGNDSEWRYISVRRLFNMVEASLKKASEPFALEPNNQDTWNRLKAMISNFLTGLWRDGGLAGAKPEQAFFVKVGLGETMTQQDIRAGKMIIEVGISAIRPAEFVILQYSLQMERP